MSTNINTFKLFTEFCENKNQRGNSLTVTQFNEVCNQAQLQLFEKDVQAFKNGGITSDFLKFFLANQTTGVPLTGRLTYPADLEHTSAIRSYYGPEGEVPYETPAIEIDDKQFGTYQASQLVTPTKEFPKYLETATEYRFLPRDIGVVMIDYFRTPVAPMWNYTVVSGRPVYNPLTSVDFEWQTFGFNAVAAIFLSLIGINLRDQELLAFANEFQMKNNPTS